MKESSKYQVVTSGGVLDGFDSADVIHSFCELFGATQEQAVIFLQPAKLINKNLSEAQAQEYKTKLEGLGLPVTVTIRAEVESKTMAQPSSLQGAVEVDFQCPKCQLAQERSAECTGCGIIFEKYNAAINAKVPEPDDIASEHPEEDIVDEDNQGIPAIAFILPVVAAIAGAFAWKAVALAIDYELGLLAWAIGGAVGAVAALMGGRGDVMGGYCAVLALVAIFAGKYMIMSTYHHELTAMFSGEGGGDFMAEILHEVEGEAEVFATLDMSDQSVKQFMVDYEYTDADAHSFVSDSELADFREEVQPWLLSDNPQGLIIGSDDEPSLASALSDVSPVNMVFESLGMIDLLFAFLGLSTAFQLGRAGTVRSR